MRRGGGRLVIGSGLAASLMLACLPSVAFGATPDGKPASVMITWGGGDHGPGLPETMTLPAGTTVTDLAAGGQFVVGLVSDGSVRIWGSQPPSGWSADALGDTKVTAIAAGVDEAMMLTEDGKLRTWGLGVGVGYMPAELDAEKVIDFGLARQAAVALTSDGIVMAWGDDGSGHGIPQGDVVDIPARVADATVTDIGVTDGRAVALLSTGEVVEWGDRAADFPAAPVGDPYTQVAIGVCDTLAITASGRVVQRPVCPFEPVPSSLEDKVVTTVDTLGGDVLALTTEGEVFHWGHPEYETPMPAAMAGRTGTAIAVGASWQTVAVLGEFSGNTMVTGEPIAGRTLTAHSTVSPTPTSMSYQWKRDDQPIIGATSPTYAVTPLDRGHRLSAAATSSLTGYEDKAITSIPTATVRMPAKTFHVRTSRYRIRRAHLFVVTASGLAHGEAYTIRIAGRRLATGHASASGHVWRRVRMPSQLSLARHHLAVKSWQTNRAGTRVVRTIRR